MIVEIINNIISRTSDVKSNLKLNNFDWTFLLDCSSQNQKIVYLQS